MCQEDELFIQFTKKQFEFFEPYPSVARRFLHVVKRAMEAQSVEEVNEVGLNCREIINDYAQQIYSCEFSTDEVKSGNTKQLLKDTIDYYTAGDKVRPVVTSLNSFVDKITRELHSITHSSSVYPEQAVLAVNLCITLITSIESLVLISERKESPIFEHFGVIKCPKCKSLKLETYSRFDEVHDELYYFVKCKECSWEEWTQ
ncbi:hypothetical protein LGL08_00115 [Clostridium estertheticum]|uniref:hypothetical protein n=1 Tax=Clostridium estertheticum TaxID=238834 RepID=UPI001CF3F155|nr:hypothetical protein [Clostridium estertheticum]MCB2305618.1 hypothetical protein [Clostridium estertheticum]MCB2344566.1 hypothetical protein [Clostridium estertheticum]MCB2347974.1 hypothetical protein [Clostridium estertheticum]WAG45618.1 hypothetical protein LL127_19195 [Clostridium estertheticum]